MGLNLHVFYYINFKIDKIELIHHVIMMLTLQYPIFNPDYLPLTNIMLFFTSGLPGAIIYTLLILKKYGYLSDSKFKLYDKRINIYLRSPGILYSVFILYLRYILNIYTNLLAVLIVSLVMFWNAQYFLSISCR